MHRDWQVFWSRQHDPRYGTDDPEFIRNHGEEIAILLGDLEDRRVLELGCGSGTLYRALGLQRTQAYRGVDFSQSMLDEFRGHEPDVQVLCADAASYRDSDQYDVVFSNQVAQYFDRTMLERHLANACAMLAPGGRILLCSVPWKNARAAYHVPSTPGNLLRYARGWCRLCLSRLGVDRLGHWYSFRDFRRLARAQGLEVRFFGCMHYPYRFHAEFRATRVDARPAPSP